MESRIYDGLELKVSPNMEPNREDIALYYGEKQIFYGYKLSQEAKISWQVGSTQSREDYLRRLLFFYEVVFEINLERGSHIKSASGLLLREGIKENAEEEVLKTNQFTGIALLSHSLYKEFSLLQVATPYVTFAMDGEGKPWDNKNGRISVSTSLDLGYHVAKLMSDTARCKVDVGVLEDVLKDVYWFGKKRVELEVDGDSLDEEN